MMEEIDIYRSAKLLIDQNGKNADLEAARMFDDMTAKGDVDLVPTATRL